MKTRLLLIPLTFLLVTAGAAAAHHTKTAAANHGPKFVLTTLEHEFGTVKPGTPLSCSFQFKNKGNADLTIESVTPSCGCTKGEFDKLVKPSKSGKITLSIAHTEKYAGPIVKTAKVVTNDPEHASFNLTLRANFVGDNPAAPATQ